MAEQKPSRGWQGAVLKLLRAGDYRLTATGRREISPHYLWLSFDGGGLLTDRPLPRRCGSVCGSPTATSCTSAATHSSSC